jgi:hypothetical protein
VAAANSSFLLDFRPAGVVNSTCVHRERRLIMLPAQSRPFGGQSCGRAIALAAGLCALLSASIVGAQDDGGPATLPAIPPGEETLIAAMLGRGALVRDCKLVSGGVEYTAIKAVYHCPHGDVALELGHPENATGPSTETGQFAITVLAGTPLPGFADDLLSRIRSREDRFTWIRTEDNSGVEDDDAAE